MGSCILVFTDVLIRVDLRLARGTETVRMSMGVAMRPRGMYIDGIVVFADVFIYVDLRLAKGTETVQMSMGVTMRPRGAYIDGIVYLGAH